MNKMWQLLQYLNFMLITLTINTTIKNKDIIIILSYLNVFLYNCKSSTTIWLHIFKYNS